MAAHSVYIGKSAEVGSVQALSTVLKTAGRKAMQVRVLSPPPFQLNKKIVFLIIVVVFNYEFYGIKKCGFLITAGKELEKELRLAMGNLQSVLLEYLA